ncbi:MAG: TldD/PmbA family protein [Gammaproteobacteria bacterium]
MAASLENACGLDFAEAMVRRATAAGADAAQVDHTQGERFELDADTKAIKLLRTTTNDDTTLTVLRDGKKGSTTLVGRDETEIENALRGALDAAGAGVVDDANQIAEAPSQAPARYGPHSADREAMLEAVLEHLAHLRERYPRILTRHAIYAFIDRERSFTNSNGVCRQERRAAYSFGTMVAAKDGDKSTSFNYSGAVSYEPFPRLIETGTVKRLMDELIGSFDPQSVPDKFVGDVIISPDCLSSLLDTIGQSLSGYSLMAQTTPYKDRQGETIASRGFSLLNRPRFSAFPNGADFDSYGVSTRDIDVIAHGVLKEFLVDFYVSKKMDLPQTAGRRNFVVPAGDTSIDSIIAGTDRGIVLSRFSGGRPNNNLDFSGVAKNSFYIEGGEIRFPLIETMVSGNFQDLLKSIRAISSESVNFGGCQFPYVAASGVTISGH